MLEPNLYRRATIFEIICHPWLKGEGSTITKEELNISHAELQKSRPWNGAVPLIIKNDHSPHFAEILKTTTETTFLDTIAE